MGNRKSRVPQTSIQTWVRRDRRPATTSMRTISFLSRV